LIIVNVIIYLIIYCYHGITGIKIRKFCSSEKSIPPKNLAVTFWCFGGSNLAVTFLAITKIDLAVAFFDSAKKSGGNFTVTSL